MARVSRKKPKATEPSLVPVNDHVRIWKTGLYARLSVEDNGKESDSIENQIAILEDYLRNHTDMQIVELYIDNGFTGTNFDRPQFQRMMDAVKQGAIDCIIVKDLSRFGRDYIESSNFIEKICPLYGLRFIAVNNHLDTEKMTGDEHLSLSLANIINDYYAKDISRKVSSALQAKMERGDFIGNYAPYGYHKDPNDKNHLIVDPITAPIIQRIFMLRAEGTSYSGINKQLNESGIPSPSQYRHQQGIKTNYSKKNGIILWNRHVLKEILSNIVYIGHLGQRKHSQCLYAGIPYHQTNSEDWVVVKNTHEALIDESLFEKVQQVNEESASRYKANHGKYDHLPKAKNIYGKKFVCAKCGAVMKLHRSFSTNRDKVYFTFKCPTFAEHGKKGCDDIKIRKPDFDEAVFAAIKMQMDVFLDIEKDIQHLLKIKKSKNKRNSFSREVTSLQKKLANRESLLSNLYTDLKEGFISQEEYCDHKEILLRDIEVIKSQLAQFKGEQPPMENQAAMEKHWKSLVKRFYDAEEITIEMVDAFVESIMLFEDKSFDITFCHADELKNLGEIRDRIREDVA